MLTTIVKRAKCSSSEERVPTRRPQSLINGHASDEPCTDSQPSSDKKLQQELVRTFCSSVRVELSYPRDGHVLRPAFLQHLTSSTAASSSRYTRPQSNSTNHIFQAIENTRFNSSSSSSSMPIDSLSPPDPLFTYSSSSASSSSSSAAVPLVYNTSTIGLDRLSTSFINDSQPQQEYVLDPYMSHSDSLPDLPPFTQDTVEDEDITTGGNNSSSSSNNISKILYSTSTTTTTAMMIDNNPINNHILSQSSLGNSEVDFLAYAFASSQDSAASDMLPV